MSADKQMNVGQELVERLQYFNDNIDSIMNKQEPTAWAVMQPDSYRVFVSYNQAIAYREDCAGGDIVPLYKQVEVLLNEEQKQAIQYFIDDSDSYDRVGIKETKIAADLLRSILQK